MKKILFILITLLVGFSLFSCGVDEKEEVLEQNFEIHTEVQKKFLEDRYQLISIYANGKKELSLPLPVVVSWKSLGVNEYTFILSESEDLSNANTYKVQTNKISIFNLKIKTPYYWCLEYYYNGILTKSNVESFIINSSAPRNLYIDGLTNARDIGGYSTSDGKLVKQGMIYRTSRLNENETTTNLITQAGIDVMLNDLGIKSELDIRKVDDNENGGITSSPLGNSVNYYSIPMISGGNLLLRNKDVIKNAFVILGDENNYPIVIHCSIGTDRTGMMCFLINALLGVSKDDLYRDFLFSNFGNIGGSRGTQIIDTYIENIEYMKGNTFAEKTYNYLLSIGVAESDLETIIRLMK